MNLMINNPIFIEDWWNDSTPQHLTTNSTKYEQIPKNKTETLTLHVYTKQPSIASFATKPKLCLKHAHP